MGNVLFILNVEAAIHKDDKWLIIKRSEMEEHAPGLLSMVGGKVETNLAEDYILENALRREVMEEVGVEVEEKMKYVESKSFITDRGQLVVDIVFICRYKAGEPVCMSLDEVSEVHWMTCAEILNEKSAPTWLKESIEKAEKIRLEA